MKPNIGDSVKLFFKNGIQVEGKVHQWSKKLILASDDGSNFMVVNHPKQILMYKINKSLPSNSSPKLNIDESTSVQDEKVENQNLISSSEEDNLELRGKRLAELYKLKIEEEKKEVAKKLKEHHITEVKKVNYELPGFLKK